MTFTKKKQLIYHLVPISSRCSPESINHLYYTHFMSPNVHVAHATLNLTHNFYNSVYLRVLYQMKPFQCYVQYANNEIFISYLYIRLGASANENINKTFGNEIIHKNSTWLRSYCVVIIIMCIWMKKGSVLLWKWREHLFVIPFLPHAHKYV